MPRALTEQEKTRQSGKLLEKGKAIVLSQGVKKISIDEIAKAAGMAKGSFYHHFESKEAYLYEVMTIIHNQIFKQAEKIIKADGGDLQANMRSFLLNLFHMPEMIFFTRHYHDVEDLLSATESHKEQSSNRVQGILESLLIMAGIDTKKVKSGVVSNYLHAMYLLIGSDMMVADDLSETLECLMESLVSYIFKS